jgi:hypothetical protein
MIILLLPILNRSFLSAHFRNIVVSFTPNPNLENQGLLFFSSLLFLHIQCGYTNARIALQVHGKQSYAKRYGRNPKEKVTGESQLTFGTQVNKKYYVLCMKYSL